MKSEFNLFVLLLLLVTTSVKSQSKSKDYLVTVDNEKIPVSVNFVRNNAKVFCDVNGKEVKYSAKKIKQIYINDTLWCQSIRTGGLFKRWLFVEIIIDGKLQYANFCMSKSGFGNSSNACREFLILNTDPRGACYKMGMTWKKNVNKAIRDCPAAIEKVKELKGYYITEITNFYNRNCK